MAIELLAEWSWEWNIENFVTENWWWLLAVVLVVMVIVIWWIAQVTSSANDHVDPAELDRQMLTAVSDLHSQGELTHEEYRSIKGRLVGRLKTDLSGSNSNDSSREGQDSKENEGSSTPSTEPITGTKANFETNQKADTSEMSPDEDMRFSD